LTRTSASAHRHGRPADANTRSQGGGLRFALTGVAYRLQAFHRFAWAASHCPEVLLQVREQAILDVDQLLGDLTKLLGPQPIPTADFVAHSLELFGRLGGVRALIGCLRVVYGPPTTAPAVTADLLRRGHECLEATEKWLGSVADLLRLHTHRTVGRAFESYTPDSQLASPPPPGNTRIGWYATVAAFIEADLEKLRVQQGSTPLPPLSHAAQAGQLLVQTCRSATRPPSAGQVVELLRHGGSLAVLLAFGADCATTAGESDLYKRNANLGRLLDMRIRADIALALRKPTFTLS
jgi:hypothetical protein